MWCIPPKQNAEFVARMEDVLEVHSRPYSEKRPVVCMDEKPFQLLDEMLAPISMNQQNHVKKYDCEYIRKGSCSIFMFTEPLGQWREAHALPHRTSEDWARQMKWLIDEVYPDAERIVLVMDNLNTHTPASFYKVFEPEEAFRLNSIASPILTATPIDILRFIAFTEMAPSVTLSTWWLRTCIAGSALTI